LELANAPDPGLPTVAFSDVRLVQFNWSFLDPNTRSFAFPAFADPVATLDPKTRYRVVPLRLERRDTGTIPWVTVPAGVPAGLQTDDELILHFTNTTSSDLSWNIRGTLTSFSWTRKHAVAPDPALSAFTATVEGRFRRYDGFDAAAVTNNTTITLDFDLIEAGTGVQVPLVNNGIVTRNWNAPSHVTFGRRLPTFHTFSDTVEIRPAVQLASGSKTYELRCTVSHVDNGLGGTHTDVVCDLAGERLLHFNGNILFGSFPATFETLSNTPLPGVASMDHVATSIRVPNGRGKIPGRPDLAWGDGSTFAVQLFDDGRCEFDGAGFLTAYVAAAPATPVAVQAGDLKLEFGSVRLSQAGAQGDNLRVKLPQGLVYLPSLGGDAWHGLPHYDEAGLFALDNSLLPGLPMSFATPPGAGVADEAHPLRFAISGLTLNPDGTLVADTLGAEYVHGQAYQILETLLINGQLQSPEMAERCSNDLYWRQVASVAPSLAWSTAADGSARLEGQLELAPGEFETHFPQKSKITSLDSSALEMEKGRIVPAASLRDVPNVAVAYFQTCPGDDCTDAVPAVSVLQTPAGNKLGFTPTGGLHAPGSTAATTLLWGVRGYDGPKPLYAHRTDAFSEAAFYMPGCHLYAADNPLVGSPVHAATAGDNAPAVLLEAGFNPDNNKLVAATTTAYRNGVGAYAGLNFTIAAPGAEGASRLGGSNSDYAYTLLDSGGANHQGPSKYYIRPSGVSGRQVAVDGSFDPSLDVYGFDFLLTSFQLTFLSNENEKSWVDGAVQVSGYANFTQGFTGLKLSCLGELSGATVDPNDLGDKSLTYWNSVFQPKAMSFATSEVNPGACPKEYQGALVFGISTQVAHVPGSLHGRFAFTADGNLTNLGNAEDFAGIDSQLQLPAALKLSGPNKDYNVVPTGRLRYSNPTAAGAPGTGFVTFAATIDIPYFRDLQVQAITSANPSPAAAFYLTPGWDDGGLTFFNHTEFDPQHRGFPSAGIGFEEFRSPDAGTSDTWLIKAEQDMFGFIALSYPLRWDDSVRRFASMRPVEEELLVAEMKHQVEWMDAKFANVSFGATYDGLPELKVSNLLNGEIDKAAQAVADIVGELPKQAIDRAFEELDKMLSDTLEAVIDPVVDLAAGTPGSPGPLRQLYSEFQTIHQTATDLDQTYGIFKTNLVNKVNSPLSFDNPLKDQLAKIAAAGEEAASFVDTTKEAVEQLILGIDSIVTGIDTAGGEPVFNLTPPAAPDIAGLLAKSGGERQIVQALVGRLLSELVEPEVQAVLQPLLDAATSELNAELNTLLSEVDPALDQIASALLQVRGFLVEVHGKLAGAGEIIQKFQQIVATAQNPGGYFDQMLDPLRQRILASIEEAEDALGLTVASQMLGQLDFLAEMGDEAFIQLLKDELKDAILESELIQQTKFLFRQYLYDLSDKLTSSVQSTLAQLSGVMKQVVSSTIGALEDKINPLVGEVNKYLGSGEISGYAEFNGDSLRKLRLDAKMQFQMPEEMSLHVWIEILCYSSEDNFVNSGCVQPGEKVVEVRIGANDVPLDWISDGLRVNLSVKMSLKDLPDDPFDFPVPRGIGGAFEMTGGELDFQSFILKEFGATIAVGLDECYFGAKARAVFSSYEMAVGLFVGRTCTLDPLILVDPDVADVLTPGTTYTGLYVYGEIWLPISELVLGIPATCLFRVDAGVGAGAFLFLEGPTIGAKIFAGISGEALCVVGIRGEVKMIGAMQGGKIAAAGTGKLSGKVGWCPICVKFSAQLKLKYNGGKWSMDY
jgi:hypothetical protein